MLYPLSYGGASTGSIAGASRRLNTGDIARGHALSRQVGTSPLADLPDLLLERVPQAGDQVPQGLTACGGRKALIERLKEICGALGKGVKDQRLYGYRLGVDDEAEVALSHRGRAQADHPVVGPVVM